MEGVYDRLNFVHRSCNKMEDMKKEVEASFLHPMEERKEKIFFFFVPKTKIIYIGLEYGFAEFKDIQVVN